MKNKILNYMGIGILVLTLPIALASFSTGNLRGDLKEIVEKEYEKQEELHLTAEKKRYIRDEHQIVIDEKQAKVDEINAQIEELKNKHAKSAGIITGHQYILDNYADAELINEYSKYIKDGQTAGL